MSNQSMLNSIELASCLIWLVIEWRNRLSKLKLCEQCLINLLNGNGCGTDDDDVDSGVDVDDGAADYDDDLLGLFTQSCFWHVFWKWKNW